MGSAVCSIYGSFRDTGIPVKEEIAKEEIADAMSHPFQILGRMASFIFGRIR